MLSLLSRSGRGVDLIDVLPPILRRPYFRAAVSKDCLGGSRHTAARLAGNSGRVVLDSMLRKVLAVAFGLFLAWRALASLVLLAGEILSYDLRSLEEAVSLSEDERIQQTLRGDYEIYATLRKTVPENGLVFFVTGSTLPTVQRALRIGLLLYPPRFVPVARLLALVQRDARADTPVFAVDLVGEEIPPSSWELVERQETFQLWRYRAPERAGA